MGFLFGGGFEGSLERQPPCAISIGLLNVPRYAAGRVLLHRCGHEFVNKISAFARPYGQGNPRLRRIGETAETGLKMNRDRH
jgi:hypothetical protein